MKTARTTISIVPKISSFFLTPFFSLYFFFRLATGFICVSFVSIILYSIQLNWYLQNKAKTKRLFLLKPEVINTLLLTGN
jgi:hypothetical protein